ncbi:MAG: AbrB/MazE/SpoVT family DNA-binding domain-containing protein [Methylotenera sp.]
MLQSLRRAGGSLVMTVPKAFIEQNNLHEGSKVNLHLAGEHLTITAPSHGRKQYRIADLMAEMAYDLPRVSGWDYLQAAGQEAI